MTNCTKRPKTLFSKKTTWNSIWHRCTGHDVNGYRDQRSDRRAVPGETSSSGSITVSFCDDLDRRSPILAMLLIDRDRFNNEPAGRRGSRCNATARRRASAINNAVRAGNIVSHNAAKSRRIPSRSTRGNSQSSGELTALFRSDVTGLSEVAIVCRGRPTLIEPVRPNSSLHTSACYSLYSLLFMRFS